jgi:hypothetical protein
MPVNIYYAAKLADYIGAESNIFAISMLDGASADIVREYGGIVSSHSVDEIFIHLCRIARSSNTKSKKALTDLDDINTSKIYDHAVSEIIKGA